MFWVERDLRARYVRGLCMCLSKGCLKDSFYGLPLLASTGLRARRSRTTLWETVTGDNMTRLLRSPAFYV